MSIQGNLRTMALPDLLRWIAAGKQTGILELERNRVTRRLAFTEGHVTACASDDPPSLIGQYLLARGKISQECLRDAMAFQEQTGEPLGKILVDKGILTADEIASEVSAKAEENIFGLFDWDDAVFRFQPDEPPSAYFITVEFSVEQIIVKGKKRKELLARCRDVFPSADVVLARTEVPLPREVESSPLATRILQSIDGTRTLAEVLLHTHASEFLVTRFLYTLHRKGVVRVVEQRPESAPAPAPAAAETPAEAPAEAPGIPMIDGFDQFQAQTSEEATAAAAPAPPSADAAGDEDLQAIRRYPEMAEQLELALQFLSQKENEPALQILEQCYRAHPDDSYLRHLINRAESGFLQQMREGELRPDRIPSRSFDELPLDLGLQPSEMFLLGMIDGQSDIKTLSWVAPLREVEVCRTLQQLLANGLIQLADPQSAGDDAAEADRPAAVRWA